MKLNTCIYIIIFLGIMNVSCNKIALIDRDLAFSGINKGENINNLNICFAREQNNSIVCEKNSNEQTIMQKTVTFNTCNDTSRIMVFAKYENESFSKSGLMFYLNKKVELYTNSAACKREDVYCFCPPTDGNYKINIYADDSNALKSNELTVNVKERQEIVEMKDFEFDVILVSDHNCQAPISEYYPHVHFFKFDNSKWHRSYNSNLPGQEVIETFKPIVFSESETKQFGLKKTNFYCEESLFSNSPLYDKDNRWCVAVEDWFCGTSDQDYDFVMTYQAGSNASEIKIHLSFIRISTFGATNDLKVKLTFPDSTRRNLKLIIKNEDFNTEQNTIIRPQDYILDSQGKYQYIYKLPKSGQELFGKGFGEAILSIKTD